VETRTSRPKRSVQHAAAAAQRLPRLPTNRHLSKRQRERRLQWLVMGGVALVVLLAVLIPAYGYWTTVIRKGDETVATVDGHNISLELFARYAGTRQTIIEDQLSELQPIAQPPNAKPSGPTTSAQAAAQQSMSSLQQELSNLPTTGVSDMIEAQLILDESQKRHLTVSQAELNDALRWTLSAPTPSEAGGYGVPAMPATVPVTGTLTLAQAQQQLPKLVGKGNYLSQAQIDQWILKPEVLKTKLTDALGANVPTSGEQVHARHILVATQAEAASIKKQLDAGADFATLAKKDSTDPGSKDQGGDLGWFGKGVMDPAFEQAAFSLKVGQISDPVKSSFGYHIIQVLAKDPNRPYDPAYIQQERLQAYDAWLGKAQSNTNAVSYSSSPSNLTWVQSYLANGN
jgi:hypothetical protein